MDYGQPEQTSPKPPSEVGDSSEKTSPGPLKKTPLNDVHRLVGARMVEFGGWDMPVQYSSILEEHRAVRTTAGLFDLSHMGEFYFSGPGAGPFLHYVLSNDVLSLAQGQARYSVMGHPDGGIVDDVVVYRLAENRYLLVVNASNIEKDFAWLTTQLLKVSSSLPGEVIIDDASERTALLAIQGPYAQQILQTLTPLDLSKIKYYHAQESRVSDTPALISRTGYTGEDGFELFVTAESAEHIWNRLTTLGQPVGLRHIGLGARDTLRLEARMALYGHEIDDTTDPISAGLSWVVKFDKPDFIGKEKWATINKAGPPERLVGFEMIERGIPRQGMHLLSNGGIIGRVCSGTFAPYLNKNIGTGYVKTEMSSVGTEFEVDVRGKPTRARVVKTPFYKRPR